jgi:hypothetical protein
MADKIRGMIIFMLMATRACGMMRRQHLTEIEADHPTRAGHANRVLTSAGAPCRIRRVL